MVKSVGVAILAAGEGKRMGLEVPKPLAPAMGRTLLDFVLDGIQSFSNELKLKNKIVAIVGHKKEMIEAYLQDFPAIMFAHQQKQLGTADALKSYFNSDESLKQTEYTLVICADTPLIRKEHLLTLINQMKKNAADAVVASFTENSNHSYGRIVRGPKGLKIIEAKDATSEIKKINEVNSGLYIFKTEYILKYLFNINSNNAANEFYLTDVFDFERNVEAVHFEDGYKFMGVNDLSQLEIVESYLRKEKCDQLKSHGVRFIDSTSVYIDWNCNIGTGSVIYPNVHIRNNCTIGSNVTIDVGNIIEKSCIKDGVSIKPYCHIDDAIIHKQASIGPYARLRPKADIGEKSKIGNFVEIKKAKLHNDVKISHLSYIGDAEIGENSNIGCGFITCNYDGANKHFTKIGKNCFIGSDSQAIAPIEIGDRCFVASGTTITKSMPDDSFAIARSKQTTKNGLASRFLK